MDLKVHQDLRALRAQEESLVRKAKREFWEGKALRGLQDPEDKRGIRAIWEAKEIKESLETLGERELLAFQVLGACRVTTAARDTAALVAKDQRDKKDSLEKVDQRVKLGILGIQERLAPREPEAKRYLLGFQESQDPLGSQDPLDGRA